MKFLLIKSLTAAICQTPKHINLLACNLAIDRCHNSTCTINPSENQENVAWLAEHFDLETESLNPYLPEKLQNKMTGQGMLQMLPGVMESDGFFVARLRKRG